MISKIREFSKNYSNLFFLISLLFIIIILVYTAFNNRDKNQECIIPNKLVNNYNNYSYNVKYEKDNEKINLYVKRYGSKYLIGKNHNDTKKLYYLEYVDLLIKNENEKYIKFNGDIIEGIDNRLLILDYLNDISIQSNLTEKSERTCYINARYNSSICINLDNSIELAKDDYKILYTINDIGSITDFNVNIDKTQTYQEVVNNEEGQNEINEND